LKNAEKEGRLQEWRKEVNLLWKFDSRPFENWLLVELKGAESGGYRKHALKHLS